MKMKVKDGRQEFAANDARDTGLVFNKPRDALKSFHLASVAFCKACQCCFTYKYIHLH